MSQQRVVLSSLITVLFWGGAIAQAEEKSTAAANVAPVTAVKADSTKAISENPPMKFSTPKSAPLMSDKAASQGEVIKFNLGYDQEKVIEEIEKTKPRKSSQYPSHKLVAAPTSVQYSGTYDYKGTLNIPAGQKSQSNSSVNVGIDATYIYSPTADYIYEVAASYYTAGATTVTNTTSPKINVLDTKATSVQTFGRANYCYFSFSNGARICPGLELVYDSYPIMNTANTGTTLATLELQKATELSGGANVFAEMPFYNSFNARFRTGYITGTGIGRSGTVGSQNRALYSNLDVDWRVIPQHSVTVGASYLSRIAVTDAANVSMRSFIISVGYMFEFWE